jgi:hypothetical protein
MVICYRAMLSLMFARIKFDVGVSPREAFIKPKVWGGLIPTYKKMPG